MPSALRALYNAGRSELGGYLSPGFMWTAGYAIPDRGVIHAVGEQIYHFGPTGVRKMPGKLPELLTEAEMNSYHVMTKGGEQSLAQAIAPGKFTNAASKLPFVGPFLGKVMPYGFSAFGIGASGYFMYKGYKGEMGPRSGAKGAWDAGVFDISMSAAIMRFGTVTKAAASGLGVITSGPTLGKVLGVGFGAGCLASVGQSLAGTPGALAGGYLGGAIMKGVITHPLIAAGVATVVGGSYLVSKGAYALLKTGYRKKQYQKRIDTAGDTTAFMTSGAKTMRERAVQAMQRSHMNSRSALGQESQFLSSNRNYFSTYRQF